MMTVAITGRSGVGKSTVTAQLRAAGICVVDADKVARDVLAVGSPCLQLLPYAFGQDICDPETGELNRRLLADRAFSCPEGARLLTMITHPEISRRIAVEQESARAAGEPLFAIDGAVIIGSECEKMCERFVVVCAPLEQSIARVVSRDSISPEMAQRRLDAQLPEETLRARADYIIENDGDTAALAQQIELLMTNLRRDADATKAPL